MYLEKEPEGKKQMGSWTERSRIWQKGGRGWWALGDESYILWPQPHQKKLVSGRQKYILALPETLKANAGYLG